MSQQYIFFVLRTRTFTNDSSFIIYSILLACRLLQYMYSWSFSMVRSSPCCSAGLFERTMYRLLRYDGHVEMVTKCHIFSNLKLKLFMENISHSYTVLHPVVNQCVPVLHIPALLYTDIIVYSTRKLDASGRFFGSFTFRTTIHNVVSILSWRQALSISRIPTSLSAGLFLEQGIKWIP